MLLLLAPWPGVTGARSRSIGWRRNTAGAGTSSNLPHCRPVIPTSGARRPRTSMQAAGGMAGGPRARCARRLSGCREGWQAGGCERDSVAGHGWKRLGQRQSLARPGRSAAGIRGGAGRSWRSRSKSPARRPNLRTGRHQSRVGRKDPHPCGPTRRDDVAWFFKMTGDDALVAEQKPAFVEFLKSVSFPAGDGPGQCRPLIRR